MAVVLSDSERRRLLVTYRRFGTTYRSHLQTYDSFTLEDETDTLFRNVCDHLPRRAKASTTPRRKPEILRHVAIFCVPSGKKWLATQGLSLLCSARFDVLTMDLLKCQVFWDVSLCRLVYGSRRFEWSYFRNVLNYLPNGTARHPQNLTLLPSTVVLSASPTRTNTLSVPSNLHAIVQHR